MGNLQFAVSSESEHVTSSAHHSQSNGKMLWKHLSRMQKKKKKPTEEAQSDSRLCKLAMDREYALTETITHRSP